MATLLYGKAAAEAMRENLRARVAGLTAQGISPTLATVQVGSDGADSSYARGIAKACESVGVRLKSHALPLDCTQEVLEALVRRLNDDPAVHGVLVFRPLPKGLDEGRLAALLSPVKDVDCMTEASLAGVYLGKPGGFAPCTPEACLQILLHYNIDCAGRHVVVLGRSAVVGRPLATLLLQKNATVTVCHSKTQNLAAICRSADVLIAAVGRPRLVTKDFVKPGALVLDVGVNWDEATGSVCGDVDFDAVSQIACAITPVPGGVGSVTSTVLAAHVVAAAEAPLP